MVASIWLRAAHRGVPTFLVTALLLGQSQMALAESPAQRQELVAALRQLDALERTVADSAAHAPIQPGERYHFDYPRLLADLARVRAGIQFHLTPSRAQPRDPSELAGDYRTERAAEPLPATTAGASNERRPGLGISSQQRYRAFRDGDRPGRRRARGPARVGRLGHPNGLRGVVRAASTSASSSASAFASSRCTSF